MLVECRIMSKLENCRSWWQHKPDLRCGRTAVDSGNPELRQPGRAEIFHEHFHKTLMCFGFFPAFRIDRFVQGHAAIKVGAKINAFKRQSLRRFETRAFALDQRLQTRATLFPILRESGNLFMPIREMAIGPGSEAGAGKAGEKCGSRIE